MTTDLKDSGYFVQNFDKRFGTYTLASEYPDPARRTAMPHYALTETQFFTFYSPEDRVQCTMWTWFHPNLNVVSGGVMAWQGVKPFNVACELLDFRNFMEGTQVENFTNYRLDSGFGVEMLDSSGVFRLTYDDPERGNSFEVIQSPASEVLMWPSNHHFEQVMHAKGQITLRGKTYPVDSLVLRDRSFGEYRQENCLSIPPNTWSGGVFGEDFSFCVVAIDDPAREPIWQSQFEVPQEKLLRFGWMIVDGEKVVVERASTLTHYDDNLVAKAIALNIVDERGREYFIEGERTASVPFIPWPNSRMPICGMNWTCKGRKGIGEVQSLQYNDFAAFQGHP